MKQEEIEQLCWFRDSGILAPDARADVSAMLLLQRTGEFDLNSTTKAVYPFLISPESPGGVRFRELLAGYSGDMLTEIWNENKPKPPNWINAIVFLSERLSKEGEGPVDSRTLLGAIIAYSEESLDSLRRGERFEYVSNIRHFLMERGISPEDVCRSLFGSDNGDDSLSIPQRYSLVIQTLKTGLLKAQVFDRWGQHAIEGAKSGYSAPHGLLIPERVVFLPGEFDEFDQLLNADPPVPEEEFQRFFEAHPKWLYLLGEQYEEMAPQIRLPPATVRETLVFVDGQIDEGDFFPDFMLKRIGLDLWDLIDIKRAKPPVVVGRSNRRKFSEAVHEAVAQVREYKDRLRQSEVREYLRREHGITVVRPVAMVVVGRDFEFRTLRERDVLMNSEGVRVYTYDDLRRLARHRALIV